jgi:hypothetical protein
LYSYSKAGEVIKDDEVEEPIDEGKEEDGGCKRKGE